MKATLDQIPEYYRPKKVSFGIHPSPDGKAGTLLVHAVVDGVLLTSSSTSCWETTTAAALQLEAYQDLLNQCYVMAAALNRPAR